MADRYLSDGACLLHGDFFPGSWLKTDHRLYVIDPEFCFFGDAEFDVGVAIAHLALARVDLATAEAFLTAYECELDLNLAARFAAVEVMRRLIGVAQLPLPAQHPRVALLSASARAMETASWKDLWL
ncbi:MAG TPA: phosphotransferase [Tepidisphaeraceae bacterium]